MTRDEWDRLSPGERDALILNAASSPDYRHSFHDGRLWLSVNGGKEHILDIEPTSLLDDCRYFVETEIRKRDLKEKYVARLCIILFGVNQPRFEDLWSLVTASPNERCLAAYNVLETTVPKEATK